jgi:Fungal protein of unknown function (DUF1752)
MSNHDTAGRGGTASHLTAVAVRQSQTSSQSSPSPHLPQPTSTSHIADSTGLLSYAQPQPSLTSPSPANNTVSVTLDLPGPDELARNELLRDAVFPAWKDASNGDVTLDSPDEMQKKDPLGTQIWKLYSRTRTRLPNQERMENLTWRMMAMNLRRREQMQAA